MKRRLPILLLLISVAMCAAVDASTVQPSADNGARILVTIRFDALDAMHGDGVERYHRPHDYRGANTDTVLDALAADYAITRVDGWPLRALSVRCEVFAMARGVDVQELAARLARDARVDSAEPLRQFRTLGATARSYRPLQHALDELDVDAAHALSRGRGVRIAVIDSGIDAQHPNLQHAVRMRRDFVAAPAAAHGTQVAGVIGARDNHGSGIVGVAPEAELLDLRACWSADGDRDAAARCDSFSLAQALDYAVTNAVDVINLSLAGPDDALLARLLAMAEARGISVVVAEPPASDASSAFPASVPSVIVAGMSENAAAHAEIATVRAPGTDVLTTFPGGRYDYASGSSLAAAHVSGLVALARALRPHLHPPQLRALLAHEPLSAMTILTQATALR